MLHNTTISHVSPELSYVPGALWTETAVPTNDSAAHRYPRGSYHSTNGSLGEGHVFLNWFGTDIWVFGGHRERLGPYRVILDGRERDYPGFRDTDGVDYDAVLFDATALKADYHQLELVNLGKDEGRQVLDLNRIVVQSPHNSTGVSAKDAPCHWGPPSVPAVWHSTEESHTTSHVTATMSFNFTVCSGIAIHGKLQPNSSAFSVILDGSTSRVLYPNSQLESSDGEPDVLYTIAGLDPGNHTLVLRNSPASWDAPSQVSVSKLTVFSAPPKTLAPAQQKRLNIVVGTVLGGVLLLILLSILLFTARRRRKHHTGLSALTTPRPFVLASPPARSPPASRPTSLLGRLTKHLSIPLPQPSRSYSRIATPGDSDDAYRARYDDPPLSPTATLIDQRRAATPGPVPPLPLTRLPAIEKEERLRDSIAVALYMPSLARGSRETERSSEAQRRM